MASKPYYPEERWILDELYVRIITPGSPNGNELFTRGNANLGAPPRDSGNCFDEGDIIPA